jgi:hypothetical protein
VPSVGSKDPVDRLELGASLEAIITEVSHSTQLRTHKRVGRRCRW